MKLKADLWKPRRCLRTLLDRLQQTTRLWKRMGFGQDVCLAKKVSGATGSGGILKVVRRSSRDGISLDRLLLNAIR